MNGPHLISLNRLQENCLKPNGRKEPLQNFHKQRILWNQEVESDNPKETQIKIRIAESRYNNKEGKRQIFWICRPFFHNHY